MLLLLIGLVLCAATAALIARAIALPRLRTEAGIAQIGAYGYPSDGVEGRSPSPISDALDSLAERLGSAILPRLKADDEAEVRTMLVAAGMYSMSPGRFLGYRTLSAVALTVTWLWIGPAANLATALFVLITPVMALMGWTIPLSLVRIKGQRRLEEIDYELPDLIDSLVVTVEAGVGFGGALRMASRELTGPLGAELQLTLQEQNMGLSTDAALENLLQRVDLPSMRSFVKSVRQGENLGVSIGEIMRSLAVEMRARRRSKAEQRAHKAPIKMLFPLTFCIFPAILIVLLYPGISAFRHAFG